MYMIVSIHWLSNKNKFKYHTFLFIDLYLSCDPISTRSSAEALIRTRKILLPRSIRIDHIFEFCSFSRCKLGCRGFANNSRRVFLKNNVLFLFPFTNLSIEPSNRVDRSSIITALQNYLFLQNMYPILFYQQ